MSTVDDLAALQAPDAIDAATQLAALLDLGSVGLEIRGARIVGRGSKASADLRLSDTTTINFETGETPPGVLLKNVPRLALTVGEACEALGVSWDFWQQHVAADVRIVRRGRRKLVPIRELERWLDDHAERALGDTTGKSSLSPPKHPANRGVRASRAPVRESP